MKLNKIHHIAIICSNYERSKKFYVNILGLDIIKEVYRKDRESYKLDLGVSGNYQIELFSFKQSPKRPSYPEARGLRHLAFEVDNIDEGIKELNDKNVLTEDIRIDEITGNRFTFFSDPDDLPIELYEK
ncbi:SMU1112c/YaeR family gloxylase I-like metalloprotein [Clostridium estertheticum]|uniref:SMU1112c/YaeR family gloxylase I-like metalloprotein n=1 Tax=Clostridium estertheticum TaxID=238834 RepID=UPI001C0E1F59|nr:VOC family protein [Clostridium estertheticum]MBU3075259.1 VOC family protein [Clostridium estertheticum]MBU3165474.1 VOC family protein [Clostridium estertheticum]